MRWFLAVILASGLSACGTDETEVRIGQSPARVYSALSQSSLAEVSALFPDLSVQRSNPSAKDILYTIPGGPGEEAATVRFRLESVDGGTATIVRSSVDAPEVTTRIGGQMKVLSEARVRLAVGRLLRKFARNGNPANTRSELNGVLAGLAIATHKDARELVLGGKGREAALSRILANLDPEMLVGGDRGWGNGSFDSHGDSKASGRPEFGPGPPPDPSEIAAEEEAARSGDDPDWGA